LDRCTELLHTLLVSLNNNKDNNSSSLVTTALRQQLEGCGEAPPLVLRPYLYPEAGGTLVNQQQAGLEKNSGF
jgi:hypothetical protein